MSNTEVHLVNPMCHLGGSELRTISLYHLLAPHCRVRIWATRAPLPSFDATAPITRIEPLRLAFPRSGTLVCIGAYFHIGSWVRFARPQRTILLYNIPEEMHLQRSLRALSLGGRRAVDIVYTSEEMRRMVGLPGVVEDSPIDLAHFRARADSGPASAARPFVVGRVSRDFEVKFAETDPALYSVLADRGYRVRIAGGTCLRARVTDARIELLPVVPQDELPAFLQGLDCFLYRTSRVWPEAYGRVVAEAMACALPVIVQPNAGIARHIRHGINGFIADDDCEVLDIVESLRAKQGHAQAIGRAARATMEELYGARQIDKIIAFYTRGMESSPASPRDADDVVGANR